MQEVKYVTYYDGEPLAIFDEKEKAVTDAKECGCEWKEVYYFPTPQKTASNNQ